MKDAESLNIIKDFGRFQKIQFLLIFLAILPLPWFVFGNVFYSASVDHYCRVSANQTYTDNSRLKNCSIPYRYTRGQLKWDSCLRYDTNVSDEKGNESFTCQTTNSSIHCDQGWVYDKRYLHNTVVTEFDLVCDKDALKQLSKSLSSLGLLIGAIVFGQLAEICGRKKTFHIATTLTMIFAIAVSFTPTFTFFIVGQFLLAFSSSSIYQTSIVLGMEASPSSRRPLIGTACTFSYAIGYILLGMTAYFVQGDWRTLQFITGAICLFYLPYICFLEESVRWLVQHGEAEKLEHMLIRADTLNKSTMEEHMINLHEMCSDFENTEPVGHASVFALFKTPILRKRSVIIIINWFAFGLMYYGISLNIDLFARDPYMIFVFTGFVEIPAGFFSGWLLARYGRRATISVAMIVSGITFLIGGVLSGVAAVLFTSTVVAKFIAKMCISGFPVYISELVPTSVRAQVIAFARCSSFIGAIVAQYIMISDTVWYLAPFLLIGIPSIVSGILLVLLPDTLDKTAPETIEDVEYPYDRIQK